MLSMWRMDEVSLREREEAEEELVSGFVGKKFKLVVMIELCFLIGSVSIPK